jgi:hypothetical protein
MVSWVPQNGFVGISGVFRPQGFVAGCNSRDRRIDVAAATLDACEDFAGKDLRLRVRLSPSLRVIPPYVRTGGAMELACLAPLVALR